MARQNTEGENVCYYEYTGISTCQDIPDWKKCDATRGDSDGDDPSGRYIMSNGDQIFCKWDQTNNACVAEDEDTTTTSAGAAGADEDTTTSTTTTSAGAAASSGGNDNVTTSEAAAASSGGNYNLTTSGNCINNTDMGGLRKQVSFIQNLDGQAAH